MAHFDLLIIGTGSGNSVITPEFDNMKIALVERDKLGGTCLNVGCIPSKMLVIPADRVVEAAEATERLGVDIATNGVNWRQIRDRVFGRIDPIVAGGTEYRKSLPNVTLFEGDARFTGDRTVAISMADGSVEDVSADQVVIAAGARPEIPHIDGLDGTPFHTSDTIMRIDELPRHLVVIGGGFIAAELGHVFSALGSKVTVIHRGAAMLRHEDVDVSQRFTDAFGEHVDLLLGARPTSVSYRDGEFRIEVTRHSATEPVSAAGALSADGVFSTGERAGLAGSGAAADSVITCDALLVAVGRIPNGAQLGVGTSGVELDDEGYVIVDEHLRTTAPGVWALGDIWNPAQLKHLANQDARVISHNLIHPDEPISIDQDVVPHAVFSHPQIGSVGLTEAELVVQGRDYLVGRCDYAGVAYGWALEDRTGFAKILIDPDGLQILGAHIIGPQASTLVQQLVQAMRFDIPADRLAREQIWCHPALPEVIENALLDALG
ncbi:MAG: mycothione reductase [Microthrixaceae bacterium]